MLINFPLSKVMLMTLLLALIEIFIKLIRCYLADDFTSIKMTLMKFLLDR